MPCPALAQSLFVNTLPFNFVSPAVATRRAGLEHGLGRPLAGGLAVSGWGAVEVVEASLCGEVALVSVIHQRITQVPFGQGGRHVPRGAFHPWGGLKGLRKGELASGQVAPVVWVENIITHEPLVAALTPGYVHDEA